MEWKTDGKSISTFYLERALRKYTLTLTLTHVAKWKKSSIVFCTDVYFLLINLYEFEIYEQQIKEINVSQIMEWSERKYCIQDNNKLKNVSNKLNFEEKYYIGDIITWKKNHVIISPIQCKIEASGDFQKLLKATRN